jgi:hypothetical protein
MKLHLSLVLVAMTFGLAACGDNPQAAPPPVASSGDDVPQSATVSPQAYQSYVASLPKSETAKPLDISKTTPPTSETAAPQAL